MQMFSTEKDLIYFLTTVINYSYSPRFPADRYTVKPLGGSVSAIFEAHLSLNPLGLEGCFLQRPVWKIN